MEEKIQDTIEEGQPTATAAEQPAERKRTNWLSRILGGEVLQSRAVLRQVPLVVMLCFYAILLVYNRYRVEDLTKERTATQDRITYLREARIEEMLEGTGIGITAGPPYELDAKGMDKYLD